MGFLFAHFVGTKFIQASAKRAALYTGSLMTSQLLFFLLIQWLRFPSHMSSHRSESAELHGPEMFLSCCTSRLHRGGTLLNQPCNSSHKMKVMHHKQERNIWVCVLHYKHEITETQSLEALRRGLCQRGDGDCRVREEK